MTRMDERDIRLMDAATRYLELIEAGQRINLTAYLATVDHDLREELGPTIEALLAAGEYGEIPTLTPAEQAAVDPVIARVLATALQPPVEVSTSAARTLVELRDAHDLSTRKLAQRVNLPVDLMARIERGGVIATSIPARLVARLAQALAETEVTIRAVLATPPHAVSVRLNARDGTQVRSEQPVAFIEALQRSTASATQRAEWEQLDS
jgi:hypothetical protein